MFPFRNDPVSFLCAIHVSNSVTGGGGGSGGGWCGGCDWNDLAVSAAPSIAAITRVRALTVDAHTMTRARLSCAFVDGDRSSGGGSGRGDCRFGGGDRKDFAVFPRVAIDTRASALPCFTCGRA